MDEDSRGDERMDIVEESSDADDESVRVFAVRPNTIRQLFGLLRPHSHSSRNASRHNAHQSSEQDASSSDARAVAAPSVPINFDTELPTEHSYLGNMTQVSGVGYLDAGKIYNMLIFVHHSMVFPGETLPMIIPDYLFDPTLFGDEAMLFGVIFPSMLEVTKPNLYGVTCQIYEKRNDEQDNMIIKCRVHQRFVISKEYNKNFSRLLEPLPRKVYAKVLILPEIILPDPLYSLNLGSLSRFRDIDALSNKLRQLQAATTIWPQYVFNQHKLDTIIERAKKFITSYKIESMPTDLTFMSFWLCRNLIFDQAERIKVFITNSVNMRMQIIEKSLDQRRFFCCSRCKNQIADCSSLFAMSKHGVQTNYCNPSGFIHETNTVYSIKPDAVYHSGEPSTEFSWFPGYSWEILLCRMCQIHVGWQFSAVKPNLVPKNFYALSSVNVIVDLPSDGESLNNDDDDHESDSDDFFHLVEESIDQMPSQD